jgi:hypothetical protein
METVCFVINKFFPDLNFYNKIFNTLKKDANFKNVSFLIVKNIKYQKYQTLKMLAF